MKLILILFSIGAVPGFIFFQSYATGDSLCERFCKSKGQGSVEHIQDSYGGCLCNNTEGWKISKGYGLYINNKCGLQ
jgi:hypothetical protein